MLAHNARAIESYTDGFERIPIARDLANYIQRCTYEKNRYSTFMNKVNNSWIQFMTMEEYNSSLAYFENKCKEAQTVFSILLDELKNMYKEQIGDRPFDIDFVDSCIVVNTKEENFNLSAYINSIHKNSFEQYNDMIARLYDDDDMTMEVGGEGKHIMSITMQVTDDCNMRCTYCYQHNKGHHSMPFSVAKDFIDMILNGGDKTNNYMNPDKLSGVILDFIGGEPFMEVELIDKICEYFLAQLFRRKHHWVTKFMFSFSSNGLLYFNSKVQNYLNKYDGFVSLGISIDGNKQLHDACRVDLEGKGTYDRAIAAAKDLMSKYGGDSTKMTISPDNVMYIYDAVTNMIELDYNMIHLNCVYEDCWKPEHASILYEQLCKIVDYLAIHSLFNKVSIAMLDDRYCHPIPETDNRNWCGGTGLMMAVDYKGDIYPCLRYMESSVGSNQPPYIVGTIEQGLCNCNEHAERLECMKCITRRSQSTDECFNCPIASGCGWCSAYNYECFGTVNKRATFICDMHKAQALATSYYIRKRDGRAEIHCPEEWAIPIIGKERWNRLVEFCNSPITEDEE